MPRPDAWTADEVADLRTIANDTTLTWAEVAAAIAARDPSRPRRTPLAVRLCASKLRLPVRTDDLGRQVRVSVPGRWAGTRADAPDLHGALDAALDAARREGRAEVLDALRELVARFS